MSPQEKQAPDRDGRRPVSKLSIIGLVLAFLVPPIGAITSIIAWRKIKRKPHMSNHLAVFGTVWGLLFTIPFLFFVWVFIAFGGLKSNGAQNVSKPFIAQIKQAGGTKLCDSGSNGYRMDDIRPWYEAYYRIPDGPGLTDKIEAMAARDGYPIGKPVDQTPPAGEQPNPESDYLTGGSGNRTLTVIIDRQTSVTLRCGSGHHVRKETAGSGTAILDINFELPPTSWHQPEAD